MRGVRRVVGASAALIVLAALLLIGWAFLQRSPQDLPWTPLDLAQPIGVATGSKLATLGGGGPRCRALLRSAGVRFRALPPRDDGPECGFDDAVRFLPGGAEPLTLTPAGVGVACPVAAALLLWSRDIVQPAAEHRLHSPVATIEHLGSYNCRRIVGGEGHAWSEHARANAIDVASFRLADGRRVIVARDWRGSGERAAFLRDVRDGACRLFATVLSPDYNAAHRDHLHLDQARRGAWGWRACR